MYDFLVVGAGPTGLEAALYGRFLGYDVTVIEASSVADSWRDRGHQSLPMAPSQCLSPLALSALEAQAGLRSVDVLPTTVGQWIDDFLVPLTETDLLRGRIMIGRVTRIEHVPVAAEVPGDPAPDEPDDEPEQDVPPDFLLFVPGDPNQSFIAEAVIWTAGDFSSIDHAFALPTDYFFRIPSSPDGSAFERMRQTRAAIVGIFAELAGRADLDLYRPRRGTTAPSRKAGDNE